MNVNFFLVCIISGIGISFSLKGAPSDQDLKGVWTDEAKEQKVEFIEQKDRSWFGKIVWKKHPNDKNGEPKKDKRNPNPDLRNNPLVGTIILDKIVKNGDKEWRCDWMYHPSLGMTAKGVLSIQPDGRLKVKGSKWGFSQTEFFTKE